MPEPLRTDRAIFAVARELLAGLRLRRRTAARLLGVTFSALAPEDGPAQLSMLAGGVDRGESARERRLARAVDDINRKLGERAIGPARLVRSGGSRSPSPPPSR